MWVITRELFGGGSGKQRPLPDPSPVGRGFILCCKHESSRIFMRRGEMARVVDSRATNG